jgi:hypothetical protein
MQAQAHAGGGQLAGAVACIAAKHITSTASRGGGHMAHTMHQATRVAHVAHTHGCTCMACTCCRACARALCTCVWVMPHRGWLAHKARAACTGVCAHARPTGSVITHTVTPSHRHSVTPSHCHTVCHHARMHAPSPGVAVRFGVDTNAHHSPSPRHVRNTASHTHNTTSHLHRTITRHTVTSRP